MITLVTRLEHDKSFKVKTLHRFERIALRVLECGVIEIKLHGFLIRKAQYGVSRIQRCDQSNILDSHISQDRGEIVVQTHPHSLSVQHDWLL